MVENKFVQVFLPEYTQLIAKNFKNFLENDLYVDLIFICDNNKKVKAHQIVFAYLSKLLNEILIDYQYDSIGKVAYICVPDIDYKIMEQIIQFIYAGQISLNTKELRAFHEAMQLLGMPSGSVTQTDLSSSFATNDEERDEVVADDSVNTPVISTNETFPSKQNDNNLDAGDDENTDNVKFSDKLPIICEVVSLSEPRSKISENNPSMSGVVANLVNNEDESIKKIAENLFVQLKKMGHFANKKLRNDKIRNRLCSNRHSTNKKFNNTKDKLGPRKFLKRNRCCVGQFVAAEII